MMLVRTIVRTMLAAAAGAALVASGTTAIRLSDPAVAEAAGAGSEVASDATARAGLVPGVVDDAVPAAPAPTAPEVVVPAPPPAPAAAPEIATPAAPAPVVAAPVVAAPVAPAPRANRAAPARPAEPAPRRAPAPAAPAPSAPAAAPAESSGGDDADDGDDGAPSTDDRDDDRADDRSSDRSGDDDASLLGGLTEPLGVSCSGSLLGSVC